MNKHPATIPDTIRKKIYAQWIKKPDTTLKVLSAKYGITQQTISKIISKELHLCKPKSVSTTA